MKNLKNIECELLAEKKIFLALKKALVEKEIFLAEKEALAEKKIFLAEKEIFLAEKKCHVNIFAEIEKVIQRLFVKQLFRFVEKLNFLQIFTVDYKTLTETVKIWYSINK